MIKALAITSRPDRPEHALVCGLAQRGVQIHVITEAPELFSDTPGVTVERWKVRSRFDFRSALKIRSLVQKLGINIVHSFSARALTTALLGTLGVGCKHIAYRGTMGHLSRLDPLAWLSFLNPRVDRLSCVSEAVRTYLLGQGVPPERAVTIYKGHSLDWYSKPACVSRGDLGIPEDVFLCGFLGNMRWVKGADILLQAIDLLPTEMAVHLLLIGEIRDQQILHTLASMQNRERVHPIGFREDGSSLLRLCDVVAMPSREREGFPKAVIEGMAQSKPAIVTRVGGMPELVDHMQSGIVVPPGDPKELADALMLLAKDPELVNRLGMSAQSRISNSFRIDKTVEQTLELYRGVLSTNLSPS